MKKWFVGLIFVACLLGGTIDTQAASRGIVIYIEGELQNYDQEPVIEKGRTLVPLRGVFETMGATWDQQEKRVTVAKDDTKVELHIGSKRSKVNGVIHQLDVPATLINNRTMVPLRFISEALGSDVRWVQSIETIFIDTSKQDQAKIIEVWEKFYFPDYGQPDKMEVFEVDPHAEPDGILFCTEDIEPERRHLCMIFI